MHGTHLNPDRFIQKTVGMAVNGHPIPVERYSYEGVFHVWDVYRLADGFKYATDAREVETPGPHHMAIIEHFGLAEGDDTLSQEAGHYTPDEGGQG